MCDTNTILYAYILGTNKISANEPFPHECRCALWFPNRIATGGGRAQPCVRACAPVATFDSITRLNAINAPKAAGRPVCATLVFGRSQTERNACGERQPDRITHSLKLIKPITIKMLPFVRVRVCVLASVEGFCAWARCAHIVCISILSVIMTIVRVPHRPPRPPVRDWCGKLWFRAIFRPSHSAALIT